MSLKAKLEAVVYAAEEPVTLALLATMFADEVGQALDEAHATAPEPEIEQIALLPEEPPTEPAAEEAQSEAAPNPEADAKRAARQRDRQVRAYLQAVLDDLIRDYTSSDRGMEIREIAGGYRMATKPEYHDAVRGFVKSLKPPMKLSLQALETLAVIAYKQPVTAPEVGEIRGVDSGGVLGSLVSRKLITTAGRKQVIGRPILYKTTKEFLLRFGLKDINDLPSMEEFEKMAGELAEVEEPAANGGEQASAEPHAEVSAEEGAIVSEEILEQSSSPAIEQAPSESAGSSVEENVTEEPAEADIVSAQGSAEQVASPAVEEHVAEPEPVEPEPAKPEPHGEHEP